MQLYISASARVGLAHPDGELALTRAAWGTGIIQMVPQISSRSAPEIFGAAAPGQPLFFQCYVDVDRSVTEGVVRRAEAGEWRH